MLGNWKGVSLTSNVCLLFWYIQCNVTRADNR